MIIVDSCGWLEWFTDGKLANQYKEYLAYPDNILMPAIILYEVYKILQREVGEEKALLAAGYMKNSTVIPFDDTLALVAADVALQEKCNRSAAPHLRPFCPSHVRGIRFGGQNERTWGTSERLQLRVKGSLLPLVNGYGKVSHGRCHYRSHIASP